MKILVLCDLQNGNKSTCYGAIIIKDLDDKESKEIRNVSYLEFYKL